MIRRTLYALAFAAGFTLALAGITLALVLWALGVRFHQESET